MPGLTLISPRLPSPTKQISSANGSVPALQKYAQDISAAAEIITSYCTLEGIPQPSFDPQASSVTLPTTAPLVVQDARQSLVASAAKIQQLATEPAEYIPGLQIHYQTLSCLRFICHFKIHTHIPLKGSISYYDLAKAASVAEGRLRSVIRMAITSNFLCEPQPDTVAHNAVSALFVTNPALVGWANFMTEYSMPTAAALAEATEKWGVTEEKNQTAFNVGLNTEVPLFGYFSKTPERADCFAQYMKSVQSSYGTSLKHLVTGYDWASLGEALVVDVGGSTCTSSVTLAEAFPQLRFVVEDLPDTILNSSSVLSEHPASIRSRISTQGYDFFTPQPFKGADIYLLRMILHDWPYAEAMTILKNHIKALKVNPDSRMVIVDTVLPTPGSVSSVEEALLRVRDLTMIQVFNSKERELGQFEELFAKASDEEGCLVLKKLNKPPGSVLSVMEVAYERFAQGEKVNGSAVNGVNGIH